MQRYFATCARGLEPILTQELQRLQAVDVRSGRGGVAFGGSRAALYQACLECRTAVRLLEPLLEFEARTPDELYDAVRTLDWSRYTTPEQTLAVDCNVRDSGIRHSQYAARRVKDAICDQFRETTGRRPSVDVERPMLGLNLHIARDHAVLSRDAAWDSLHKRGYRPVQTKAPLNEALAAGLLLAAGWTGSTPLVDWMCGGGTLLIEGAWIAQHRPPALTRKWFSMFAWPDFDRELFLRLRDQARSRMHSRLTLPLIGSDARPDAIRFAQENARAAGVAPWIQFQVSQLASARPPAAPPGLIMLNPPYGERLGDVHTLTPLYQQIGQTYRNYWSGWRLAIFALHEPLVHATGLSWQQAIPFYNGKLPCKLFLFK